MKRSTQIATPLLAATALALLTGCREPQMQRCVDENNKVVDQSFCRDQNQQQNNSSVHIPSFHYYYGGYGSYDPGTIATGGSLTPVSGVSYSSTRGGFGSSFGGEGEGAGHGGGAGE